MDQLDQFDQQQAQQENDDELFQKNMKRHFGVDYHSLLSEKIEAIISEKTPEYIYPMVDEDLIDEELERLTIIELNAEAEAEEDDLEN